MLIGFSVSNFKSFNTTQTFSMQASRIVRHSEHVVNTHKKRILKASLIYGANASGKSNLVEAMSFSHKIILGGLDDVDLMKKYFRFYETNYKEPGVFEYRMLIDGQEYSYGFAISYNESKIISEWLYRINQDTEICIYDRNFEDGSWKVTTDLKIKNRYEKLKWKIYIGDYQGNVSHKLATQTILGDLATRSLGNRGVFAELVTVFRWFMKIIVIFPDSHLMDIYGFISNMDEKEFFESALRNFDTGIDVITSEKEKFEIAHIFQMAPEQHRAEISADINSRLDKAEKRGEEGIFLNVNFNKYYIYKNKHGDVFYKKMVLKHRGGGTSCSFDFQEESDGTKRLFDLIPILSKYMSDKIFIVDEIDRSIHSNLIKRFLNEYYTLMAGTESQLIATTHDANLLDLDLVRQDEVWFVERQKDSSSKLYSLNKFKERFDKKIDKEYLIGRYGAIPEFK